MVILLPHALQRGIGVEHASAARAEDVPGHLEEAEPRRLQKGRDDVFLVETAAGREADRVDARELLVRAVPHKTFDRAHRVRIRRATQGFEESIGIVHTRSIPHRPRSRTELTNPNSPCRARDVLRCAPHHIGGQMIRPNLPRVLIPLA